MKYSFAFLFLFFAAVAVGQEDYTIRINDSSYKVSLDKKYDFLVNGKKVSVSLSANDTMLYRDDMFSFNYPKGYNVSKTPVEDGLEQIVIVTAEGSGIILQKYTTLNPTAITEMILSEVTKESISYGFAEKRETKERTLKSGQKISVEKSVLTYKDETNMYEIAAIGKKDEGLVIMTMKMDNNMNSEGQKVIDMMWKTLRVK